MNMKRSYLKGAVIYYGAGEVTDFRLDLPTLFARAGLDRPSLNHSIDELYARAVAANAPVTLINFSGGHHGFELRDDNADSLTIVDDTIAFVHRAVDPVHIAVVRAAAAEAGAGGVAGTLGLASGHCPI